MCSFNLLPQKYLVLFSYLLIRGVKVDFRELQNKHIVPISFQWDVVAKIGIVISLSLKQNLWNEFIILKSLLMSQV